ncbi:52 kDa repressor of the inhibitor of the protein kinase-like [Gigantopelta aegis]|uniref:52 kDa repressor of the inhibitor of the protein kinase-like n=1 Tax=Gigantopelta aegis TaxID=1735272 RepID=UPI001B887599|nr:52 kDa repressor of the inhibitor of the protein kinase-like [Gigantopelta aegis]
MSELEKNAWLSFKDLVKNFLGNTQAKNYTEIVQKLLESYKTLGCIMSIMQIPKDGTTKFKKHQNSDCHKDAFERHIQLPQQTKDAGESLSAAHSEEKINNRHQLLTILRSIHFLALQGLPLRDHDDSQSNFIQILKLYGQSDESILKWMEKKTMKFTSADMQNEILQVMAPGILRQVAKNIRDDGFFTIMADETTDQSNREQVVIVLRHVDSDLTVYEEFTGLYVVPSIDAQTLTH